MFLDNDEDRENRPHIKVHRHSTIKQFLGWSHAPPRHPCLLLRIHKLGIETSQQTWISMMIQSN